MTKIHTRSFHLREIDSEARTVAGVAVPYDVPTSIHDWFGTYTETFERGSVTIPDSGKVMLYWRHGEPIGLVTEQRDAVDGWHITAQISKTPRGDEAYTLLRDGVIDEFSIGFEPIEHREDDTTGAITRTRVLVREVSLVPLGAYGSAAGITEVREQDDDTTAHERSTPVTTTEVTAADLAEVRGSIEELTRSVSTLSARDNDAPALDTRSAGEILKAIASGDEATIRAYNDIQSRAYTGGTSADSVAKDGWVGDLTRIFDGSSGVLASIFSTGQLPATGLAIEYGELEANTVQVTAQAAEGDDLAFGKVTLTTKTAPVKTYGGYTQLTRQSIERSTLPVLNRSLEALAVAAGARKKAALRAAYETLVAAREAVATNGGVVLLGATLAASAAGNWEDALVDAAIKYDLEDARPEALIVSATVFKKLRSLTVSGERVFTVAANNASGALNLPGLTGNLAGLPVYLDAGQAGDKAVFVNGRAVRSYDSALVSLQDENVINLSKDFSVYRYGAVAAEVPQFVVPVKLAAS